MTLPWEDEAKWASFCGFLKHKRLSFVVATDKRQPFLEAMYYWSREQEDASEESQGRLPLGEEGEGL